MQSTWVPAAAYATAMGLAILSAGTSIVATRVNWLVNPQGHSIALNRYCVRSYCGEFPPPPMCKDHAGFCGAWRTTVFVLMLAIVPEVLELLALWFSWAFRHRKKSVTVIKYLSGSIAILQVVGLFIFSVVYPDLPAVLSDNWVLVIGYKLIALSIVAQLALFFLMLPFRRIVKGPDEPEDYNSDEEAFADEDDDAVSVDEDVPEEERDFYIFNKQARRRYLAALSH